VSHLTLVAGRRAGIKAALRQMNATLSDPAVFWIGQSEPAVSAAIQGRLREVVSASGGSLRSTTDLPTAPDHGLSRVALRLQAEGTVPTLQAVLYAIETSKPALFVDGFAINASDSGAAAAGQPPMLSIQLDVFGFSRTP
jgi:general secretion pathway protein M